MLYKSSYKANNSSLEKQRITKSKWVRLVQSVKADNVDRSRVNKQTSVVITTTQLWIVNSRMISIHTHSILTLCYCKSLARSLSNKFNSEFKQIENLIRKAKQKALKASWIAKRIVGVQAGLWKCERVKIQSCSKHPKANIEKQTEKSKVRIPVRADKND